VSVAARVAVCVAVCGSVLQCVAARGLRSRKLAPSSGVLQCVLQRVAVCCNVLQQNA